MTDWGPRIVRIFGNIDGMQVSFEPQNEEQTQWAFTFYDEDPKEEYIVDLYLEDWVGNIGYFATVVFEVDIKCMTVSWRVTNYNVAFLPKGCNDTNNFGSLFGLCK